MPLGILEGVRGPVLLTIVAFVVVLTYLLLIRAFLRSPKDRVPQSRGAKGLFFWRRIRSDYIDLKANAESAVARKSDGARAVWGLDPVDTFTFGYYVKGFDAEPETFSLALAAVTDSDVVFADEDQEIDSRWELGRVSRAELRAVEVENLPEGAEILKVEEGPPTYDGYDFYLWGKTDILDKFGRPAAGGESRSTATRGRPVTHRVVVGWEDASGAGKSAHFAFDSEQGAVRAADRLRSHIAGKSEGAD